MTQQEFNQMLAVAIAGGLGGGTYISRWDGEQIDAGIDKLMTPGGIVTADLADGAVTWPKLAVDARPIRRNLLVNWDFANPVNQRGKTTYAGGGYGIDRWKVDRANFPLTVANGYISVERTMAAGSHMIFQFFENPVEYAGKTLTISVLARGDQNMRIGLIDSAEVGADAPQKYKVINLTAEWSLYQYTYTTVDGVSAVYVQSMAADVGKHIDIRAAKLELGAHQTLAHQDADGNWVINELPDYGLELLNCQQYQIAFPVETIIGVALCYEDGLAYAAIQLPTTLRGNPTIDKTKIVVVTSNYIYTGVHPTSIFNVMATGNGIGMSIAAPGMVAGQKYFIAARPVSQQAPLLIDANL